MSLLLPCGEMGEKGFFGGGHRAPAQGRPPLRTPLHVSVVERRWAMPTEKEDQVPSFADEPLDRKTTLRCIFGTGILLGIGIMAFLDETLLHQLLQWHTFYWNTDQHGRILSDGLFHAFSTLVLLWGALRLWRSRNAWTSPARYAIVAAIFIGAGAF